MRPTISFLIAFAVSAALSALHFYRRVPDVAALSFADEVQLSRAEAYRRAAEAPDAAALELQLQALWAMPFSARRDHEIDAVIERLAGLDLGRAIALVQAASPADRRLVKLFQTWAEIDWDASVSGLRSMPPGQMRLALATALLNVSGYGEAAMETLAQALAPEERAVFRSYAYALWAQTAPDTALSNLFTSRPPEEWALAIELTGRAWGRRDPLSALTFASSLPDEHEVQSSFVRSVVREWSLTHTAGFLTHARRHEPTADLAHGLVSSLAARPAQVLEIAAEHPSVSVEEGSTLEEVAIGAVAERDRAAALRYLDTIAAGDRLTRARRSVAKAWAASEPDEALLWARSLRPPAPEAVAAVIVQIAASDVDAALRHMDSFDPPPNPESTLAGEATVQAVARKIVQQIASPEQFTPIADRLLFRRTPHALIALQELIGEWTQFDAGGVMDWVVAVADELPLEMLSGMATQLATSHPEAAAAFTGRLPPSTRLEWAIRGAAHSGP